MKVYNIGILGAGRIARTMAETIHGMKNARCYAIASRTLEKAERFAEDFGFEKAYGSYKELAADEQVDLIYIATPHSEHLANTKLCIQYHKPALVEKAFTVNAGQAEELLALAKQEKVFVTEAIWVRYMPFLEKIREVVNSGIIGKPKLLTANLGYNIVHKSRLVKPELAGGALLDVGVYALNFACMIFGTDFVKTSSVCTYAETGVDEQDSMTLIYPDGKMAVLNASMVSISDRKGIIHGEKGFIIVENINNFESITVYDDAYREIAHYDREKQITGYEYEVEAALKAIESGALECGEMPHAETIRMMEIMDGFREEWKIMYPCESV